MSEQTLRRVKLVALLAVMALAATFWSVFHDQVDPGALRHELRAAGWGGAATFVLAFGVLQGLFWVSAHLFMVLAGLVWDAGVAVALSWTGTLLSGTLAFFFARFVARRWVSERISGSRFERYQRPLVERGFRTVTILRVFCFTTPPLQLMLGASAVSYRDFLLGTMVGNIPAVLLTTLTGTGIAALLGFTG